MRRHVSLRRSIRSRPSRHRQTLRGLVRVGESPGRSILAALISLRRGAVTDQPAMPAPDAKRLAPQKDTGPLRKALCKSSAKRAQRRLFNACIADEGKYLTRRRRADPGQTRRRELERPAVPSCATSRDLARLFHFRLRPERPDAPRAHERSAKNLAGPHLIHRESRSAVLLLAHSLW